MALNEADSGLPVVEPRSGPRRHQHHPGSMAPVTTLVSASEHPNGSSSPAPVQEELSGAVPTVWLFLYILGEP